jgi:VWFA-related protein
VTRLYSIAALLCLTGGAGLAQRNTVIQTGTRVVLVDAIVTGRKGEYVRDLTAKDFRVWEDNKEQAIKSLSLEGASADAGPRYMVLFLDSAGMEARDQVPVRQAVSSFIDANAGPNRMMAVMDYNGSMRVAQKFTDNAGRLKDAVKAASFSGVSPGVTTAATDLHARDMLRSLSALARSMSTLPGRKILVLLTGYLSPSTDHRVAAEAAIEAAGMSGVAIYPIDVRPISVTSEYDSSKRPSFAATDLDAPSAFRRLPQPAAESATDAQDPAATSQQILLALANGTGGFVIPNSSALLGGLQGIEKEQHEYYVLSYVPPESKEGSCHALRVKVDRPGTSVRARSNYCTVKPLDLLAGTSAGKELENRAAGAQPGNIAASMQLPYFYNSSGVARVNVAMEIMPGALKFENQKGRLHAEINLLGLASTPDGGVGARFSDAVKLDFDSQAQIKKLKEKPLHYEKEFKIAPGRYSFTMVLSSGDANFGKLEMPLVVDAWKTSELALSGLVLSREVHPASDLDLGLETALIGDHTPLIAEGRQVVPSGSNQFLKSEPAYFYFEVYGPNSAAVAARARVLDRQTGLPKWDSGPLKLSSSHQGGTIPVSSLVPGSYRLEVAAGDAIDAQVKRVADFEVK